MRIIDSHTGGEPTRTIVSGGPDISSHLDSMKLNPIENLDARQEFKEKGCKSTQVMAARRAIFQQHFDHYRTALVREPRGSEVMVGALLTEPFDANHAAGVIFFNNHGFLNMCGHGTIGVAVTLFHLGKIGLGLHTLETPVGLVTVNLLSPNRVEIENVASYRSKKNQVLKIDGEALVGDIAWGGNWFFLTENHELELEQSNIGQLLQYTTKIKHALVEQGVCGEDGGEIDHIELIAQPQNKTIADSQNFVLCPGAEYDRSPCGTGTSAKLACLAADGKLAEGEVFRQQSIIGSIFEGQYKLLDSDQSSSVQMNNQNLAILPRITGEAFITLDAKVHFDPKDPYQYGI
jgi:4-hydroxyproline epimerase